MPGREGRGPAEGTSTLAGLRPGQLVARTAAAGVLTGVLGGTATAWLAVLTWGATGSAAGRALVVLLAVGLGVTAAWQLAATAGHAERAPSARWTATAAGLGLLLVTVVVATWPDLWSGQALDDPAHVLGVVVGVSLLGATYGLVPAALLLLTAVPALLLLRARRARTTLLEGQLLLTLLAAGLTAAFAVVLAGSDLAVPAEVCSAAVALAAAGAALAAPHLLDGREA